MKRTKIIAIVLCLLMVCTVVLYACKNNEIPDNNDTEQDNNGNNIENSGANHDNERSYQVADETEWRKVILGTINYSDINIANFTIHVKYSEYNGMSKIFTWMCADSVFYESYTEYLDEEIQSCNESYYDADGGYGYGTSEERLKDWEEVYSFSLNSLADLFDDFKFSNGVYTAYGLGLEGYFGLPTVTDSKYIMVLNESGIKSINIVKTEIEDDEIENLYTIEIEISNVGTTKIVMPKV